MRPIFHNYSESINDSVFIGREQELNFIINHFANSNEPLVVTGHRGIGKTSLIHKYLQQERNHDTLCLYAYAERVESTDLILPILAKQIEDSLNINFKQRSFTISSVLSAIPSNLKTTIVIEDIEYIKGLDYLKQQNFLQEFFIHVKRHSNVRLILSSRQSGFENVRTLHIHDFNLEQILVFLHHRLSTNLKGNFPLAEVRDYLFDRLNGNPRDIQQIIYWLENGFSLEHVREKIETELESSFDTFAIVESDGRLVPFATRSDSINEVVTSSRHVINFEPYIYIPRVSSYWKKPLEHFEKLINSDDTTESQIQNFFESNPFFLKNGNYSKVYPHTVLMHNSGTLIPDFLLKPVDSTFCDILELKLPKHKFVSGSGERVRFSCTVYDAIAQIREYRTYFDDKNNRNAVLNKYGITAYKPSASILIGREPKGIDEEKLIDLRLGERRDNVDIISYDKFFAKMKKMIE